MRSITGPRTRSEFTIPAIESGEVRAGPAYLWTDVWLQLIRLMLERVASREWATNHSAPKQVMDSAWDAIATSAKDFGEVQHSPAASVQLGR